MPDSIIQFQLRVEHAAPLVDTAGVISLYSSARGDSDKERVLFRAIDSPALLRPLRAAGAFDSPPRTKQISDGGVMHPAWPAGEYLSRVAEQEPSIAAEIVRGTETDNSRVILTLLEIGAKLPGREAASIVPKVAELIRASTWFLFWDVGPMFVAHLIRSGLAAEAEEIMRALVTVEEVKDGESRKVIRREALRQDGGKWFGKACLGLARLDFGRAHELVSGLMAVAGGKNLIDAVSFYDTNRHGRNYWYDESAPSPDSEALGYFTHWLLKCHLDAIDNRQLSAEHSVILLSIAHGDPLFKRVALEVLYRHHEEATETADLVLRQRSLFRSKDLAREYQQLLNGRFAMMREDDRQTILSWVRQEADEAIVTFHIDFTRPAEKRKPSAQEIAEFRAIQQWRIIRDLPESAIPAADREWRDGVRDIVETAQSDRNQSQEAKKAESPNDISQETLDRMTAAEVLRILGETGLPVRQWNEHNKASLRQKYLQTVLSRPQAFINENALLAEAKPEVVRVFLDGIKSCLQKKEEGEKLNLAPLIELGRAISAKENPSREKREWADEGRSQWGWTRSDFIDVVEVCIKNELKNTWNVREEMKDLLASLCQDQTDISPDEDFTGKEGLGCWNEFLTEGMNRRHGKAMQALIDLASWIHEAGKENRGTISPDEAKAEVGSILKIIHEFVESGKSPMDVHAMLGASFVRLWAMESDWAKEHIASLFKLKDKNRRGWAAWATYLAWCRPYQSTFEALRETYRQSMDFLGEVTSTRVERGSAPRALAEHLIILYGWGEISFDEVDRIIETFFDNAPVALHREAFDFIGGWLCELYKNEDDVPPKEFRERFKKLWDWYKNQYCKTEPHGRERVIAEFVGWFASGAFDDDLSWALPKLKEAGRHVDMTHDTWQVIQSLGKLVSANSDVLIRRQIVECATALLHSDYGGGILPETRKGLKAILDGVKDSKDKETVELSANLVDRLVRTQVLTLEEALAVLPKQSETGDEGTLG